MKLSSSTIMVQIKDNISYESLRSTMCITRLVLGANKCKIITLSMLGLGQSFTT